MRTLVIECATEACSVALLDNGDLVASDHKVLGRGHAERLVPMIAGLPQNGRADRIAVSLGPGSFTGVRVGIAAARALGVAWDVPVVGFSTLALVAATARYRYQGQPVSVAMTGGHGEWFFNNFGADGLPEACDITLHPDDLAAQTVHHVIAGTQAEKLAELRGDGISAMLHPDAKYFPLIPRTLISDDVTPRYGRPPDASLPPGA
ncbi:tRNA (adenosine(37)-N6)-threonylcarbamoyltransferase complex dimerization subunit type 1 TsaB [Altererythrobacter aquiaggeris]|uniref:tRNA (adenosine(37)-N6)-threonylcarbamoyltransferase complex dimerization subunit type 1 TsaB n=1 Tax=Aestuarierythrobacter aquiaggeris TaxID=1898396 RepID=UPI00301B17CD